MLLALVFKLATAVLATDVVDRGPNVSVRIAWIDGAEEPLDTSTSRVIEG